MVLNKKTKDKHELEKQSSQKWNGPAPPYVKGKLSNGFWLLVLKIEKGGKKTFLHLCGRIFMFDIFRDATTVQPMCGLPA
jgi:hypothetical protein